MAITKVGVLVSSNSTFGDEDDLDFYSEDPNDCKLGTTKFHVTGLTPSTLYETQAYFVQDGETIKGDNTEKFETLAE